jgi:hypothetical protein
MLSDQYHLTGASGADHASVNAEIEFRRTCVPGNVVNARFAMRLAAGLSASPQEPTALLLEAQTLAISMAALFNNAQPLLSGADQRC